MELKVICRANGRCGTSESGFVFLLQRTARRKNGRYGKIEAGALFFLNMAGTPVSFLTFVFTGIPPVLSPVSQKIRDLLQNIRS